MYRIIITLFLLMEVVAFRVAASDVLPDVPKGMGTITVDGQLNESVWTNAASVDLKYITWPQENSSSTVKTTVKYFEYDNVFYVAFDATDPNPDKIRAYFNDRDEIDRDDLVGVKLDPYNDHRVVYQFFVNPVGVQLDSIVDVIGETISESWDGIWDSAGIVHENGFTVEMAIPLRNFNFNPSIEEQTWAIEFLRYYPRKERQRLSNMPIDRNNDCRACQMREIQGFAGARQGKSLALTPTIVAGQSESRSINTSGDGTGQFLPWETEDDVEVGLNIKWGISSDVFLNATINPDFSQVEADAGQLGINKNFTLFFEEKRPFFLENQDTFNSNFDLVYTRNISEPDIGVKLTGKSGKHTFGIFAADDERTTLMVPGNLGSGIAVLDQDSKNAALRYRYDANNDLSVGVISTFRTSDDYHNYVGSVDVSYKITPQDTLRVQAVHSDTEYPDWLSERFCGGDDCTADDIQCEFGDCILNERVIRARNNDGLSDQAWRIRYNHDERNWYAWLNYEDVGRDHRVDLGFETRTDFTEAEFGGGLKWYGDDNTWWSESQTWFSYEIIHNEAGELIEKEITLGAGVEGPWQSWLEGGCRLHEQVGNRIDGSNLNIDGNTILFNRDTCWVYGYIQPIPGLYMETDLFIGNHIDFANNREAERTVSRPAFAWSINAHLKAELNYYYEKLEAEGDTVFTANQADFRLRYNLDVRNSLRLSVIYTRIDQNLSNQPAILPENLPDESFSDIAIQLIYSYKINPQTVIFAGYSDHAFKNDVITSYEKDDRNLFLKMSYAWLH